MNTINNVPRELLERVKSLCEYWFVRGQQQHMSATEYKTWHALGFESSAFTELRALLSAPSPAGVDGLEVVAWSVSFPSWQGTKVYEQRQEWAYRTYGDIAYTVEDLCRLSDAQAIIDGQRGEAERSKQFAAGHVLTNERISASLHAVEAERDQHAKRIGELEGLLREVRPSWKGKVLVSWCADRDAALSAGKEGAK